MVHLRTHKKFKFLLDTKYPRNAYVMFLSSILVDYLTDV